MDDEDAAAVERHYDSIADIWADFVRDPTKAHVLWPAVRSLLPPVDGERVLDAGCGNGHYSAWLADRGAEVVGIDASDEMLRTAEDEYGDDEQVDFHRARLDEPLESLADDAFDLVLCQHVFSHLPSLETPLSEFARVLRPGGTLVLSTHHPFHDFRVVETETYPDVYAELKDVDPVVVSPSDAPNYHETERFEIRWAGPDGSNPGRYYRRSVSDLLEPLLAAGFELRALEEPQPDDAFEAAHPDHASELNRRPPRSICLRAERR